MFEKPADCIQCETVAIHSHQFACNFPAGPTIPFLPVCLWLDRSVEETCTRNDNNTVNCRWLGFEYAKSVHYRTSLLLTIRPLRPRRTLRGRREDNRSRVWLLKTRPARRPLNRIRRRRRRRPRKMLFPRRKRCLRSELRVPPLPPPTT